MKAKDFELDKCYLVITSILILRISKRLPQIFASSLRLLLGVILWLATIRTPRESMKWGFQEKGGMLLTISFKVSLKKNKPPNEYSHYPSNQYIITHTIFLAMELNCQITCLSISTINQFI